MQYCYSNILICLVLGPPGIKTGGHSYCCDFDKSLFKPRQGSNPFRFSIDENYARSYNDALECPSIIDKYWNISGVLVLVKNMIFFFFFFFF